MRRAIVEVAAELLIEPGLLSVLSDAGLVVERSLSSLVCGVVRLVIAGDSLPDFCEGGMPTVEMIFKVEHFGRQRIVRIADIRHSASPQVVAQWVGDHAAVANAV